MNAIVDPPTLHRGLTAFDAVMITLSAISPASSVFIILPGVIALAGSGALLSLGLAAIIGLCMALVYAELCSAIPHAGAEYVMIARMMGRAWGFITFTMVGISLVLIIAVIALGIGTYLSVLIPGLNGQWAAVAAILVAAGVAILNIRTNAWITGVFLAVELVAVALLVFFGFINPQRSLGELLTSPQMADATGALTSAPFGAALAAVAVALFALNGYGGAAYFAEETKDPRKTMAKVIIWALLITALCEVLPLAAVLVGAPDMAALLTSPQKIEYFIDSTAGHGWTIGISLAIAVAIFNAVIAIVLQTGRLLFASGRDRLWSAPISNAFGLVHPTWNTPWFATLTAGALGAAACFVPFEILLVVSGTSLVAIYALLCIAVIIGRQTGKTSEGFFRMPLFPLPAVVALAALAYVGWQNFLDPVIGRPSLGATLAMMVFGGLYYAVLLARRTDWGLHSGAEG